MTRRRTAKRRDHARLRREQQRFAALAGRERLDVVREHPLQVCSAASWTGDADERARAVCVTVFIVISVGEAVLGSRPKRIYAAGSDAGAAPPRAGPTEKWPVLHTGGADVDLGAWDFRVFGVVGTRSRWTCEEFRALPRAET